MAGGTLVLVLVNLLFLPVIEKKLATYPVKRVYKIFFYIHQLPIEQLEYDFTRLSVRFSVGKLYRRDQILTATYTIKTKNKNFNQLNKFLVDSSQISSFEV